MRRFLLTPLALLAALPGCVTEVRTSPPPPSPGSASLPTAPVATPAFGSITNTRVRVSVRPLGSVPYDGVILPIISPDGRFLAVQQGAAPTWPTLLATDDATIPLATTLAIYDLHSSPIRRIDFAQPLQPGLILGRGCDTEGFLIEAPLPEGGRWIGKVAWASGRLQWLVQGASTNAHAVLTTNDELIYTRRAPGSPAADLILRTPAGRELVRSIPGGSYAMPMAPLDPAAAYALIATEQGLDLEAIAIVREPPESGDPRWGATLARANISSNAEPAMAYQVAAPTTNTAPLHRRAAQTPAAPEPLAIFHPRLDRMAALDTRSRTFAPLAEHSIAAAWWPGASEEGFFCTSPEGLVFVRQSDLADPSRAARATAARVLAGPYVPRRTTDADRPFILLGPARNDPGRIELTLMAFVGDDAEDPPDTGGAQDPS